MNIETLQKRFFRILTRPPELLYALAKHWRLLLVFMLVAGAFRWSTVVNEKPVYEGRARLIVAPSGPAGPKAGRSASFVPTLAREQAKTFLSTHAGILSSDTLIRTVLTEMGLPAPRTEDGPDGVLDRVRGGVKTARRKLSDALQFERIEKNPLDPEQQLDSAVAALQKRSKVTADPQSQSILLQVYGPMQKELLALLDTWIKSYSDRIRSMSTESWSDLLAQRIEAYGRLVEKARKNRDDFEKADQDAKSLQMKLTESERLIARLQLLREDVLRERQSEFVPVLGVGELSEDPQIAQLQAQLIQARRGGAAESSQEVQRIKKLIESLQGEEGVGDSDPGDAPVVSREERLQKKYDDLGTQLADLYVKHANLKDKADRFRRLEEELARAEDQLESMKSLRASEVLQTVQIITSDGPTVDSTPFEYHPTRKVALGAMTGVAIAAALALLLEILSGKVRFKHDITDDLDLPVIAVFPK